MAKRSLRGLSVALGLAASSLVASCAPPLEQVWQLRGFRVFAIVADPPEPDRGATTTLSLATTDTRSRPVQVAWFACAAPPGQTGERVDAGMTGGFVPAAGCSQDSLQIAFGNPAQIRVPMQGGTVDGAGRETLSVFGYACAGGTIGLPEDGGVTPTCNGMDAQGWLFTRTLPVHRAMSPNPANSNPVLTEVRFAGQVITETNPPRVARCVNPTRNMPCPTFGLEVAFADGAREMYQEFDGTTGMLATRQERLVTGFAVASGTLESGFRSDSSLEPIATMANRYSAGPDPGTFELHLYVRDGRGGFTTARRTIVVE